jgi:hypothetical protein
MGTIYFGGDSPGDDTHSLIWDAVSSWLALRNSSSRSLPYGSFSAARLKASACSRHFCSGVSFLLPMNAPPCFAKGGSATSLPVTDGCPAQCGDGKV